MKLKSYLMSLHESGKDIPQNTTDIHKNFKSGAEVRQWYLGEHKQKFYAILRSKR